ncbi:GNAT family N-acetyltransferase [Fulvimarina sp. 2208YS6-2-32]|uniref:GNAT family N-acetyltransferase n=1 Tax=Fulvimarina uroteuthidis TaxID=3098149 RepID=A0ABU5I087_9HYPH|nr:GNAT family N-acetyltransferase [Fulvimarina sp. 2208YS6-2-32]MDY8108219.1 GNAT family N-acetyltransferase [Fulvimarina sp. 2208YS6-2-32]
MMVRVELLTTRVTSLEMTLETYGTREPVPAKGQDMRVFEVPRIPLMRYRELYSAVGAAHHWTSRLVSDKSLADEIHSPRTRIYLSQIEHETVGWFEIEIKRNVRQARIVHFGILGPFRGKGLAGPLLEAAIAAGFDEKPERLTIETNTLDHPAAFALYRKHGFTSYATREVKTPTYDSFLKAQLAAD